VADDTAPENPVPTKEDGNTMAMTNGEATAVNTLLRYFLGNHPKDLKKTITTKDAREAAGLLAASANKKLMAGLDKKRAEELFDRAQASATAGVNAA
jgi:hypothetical protein